MIGPMHHSCRRCWIAAVALSLLALVGCSDGGDGNDDQGGDGTTTTLGAGEGVGSDLVTEGRMTCADVADDVTVSAETQAAPPVETPGVDILDILATLDDETFTTTFTLVDAPVIESRPEYIVFVGYPEDVSGFEIQLQPREGLWMAELVQRSGESSGQRTPLVNATVAARDNAVILNVPAAALPPISASQPVFFGSSALLYDGEHYVDVTGSTVAGPDQGLRAIDDCTQFGQ
jgi:hypothetical protein